MQGRARQLQRRRRNKLRRRHAADVLLCCSGEGHVGRQQRRDVEGREDSEAVAGGEEGVCHWRDGPGGDGAEQAGELAVFVEAEGEVCG